MLLDQINKMKFDVRMVESNLKKKFITSSEYTQHLNDLPESHGDTVEFSKLAGEDCAKENTEENCVTKGTIENNTLEEN